MKIVSVVIEILSQSLHFIVHIVPHITIAGAIQVSAFALPQILNKISFKKMQLFVIMLVTINSRIIKLVRVLPCTLLVFLFALMN